MARKKPEPPREDRAGGKKTESDALDDFFVKAQETVRELPADSEIVLNIPIWGWTGHGKTCSLLTALHYCEADEHAISLALVHDTEDLLALEQRGYKGLGLVGTAERTAETLRDLQDTFLEKNQWPAGTDSPEQYLLELRTEQGRIGYTILPDIKGGNFEQNDEVAKNAIENAHAFVAMIDAVRYVDPSPAGKRYRDMVKAVVFRCVRDSLPTALLLTKADEESGPHGPADEAYKRLSSLLTKQKEFTGAVFRVSAVGAGVALVDGNPPPVEERHPIQLVRAFVWILLQALETPRDQIRARAPRTNLAAKRAEDPLILAPHRELRLLYDSSDSPGRLLGSVGKEASREIFLFAGEANELIEVSLDLESDEHQTRSIGEFPGFGEAIPIQVRGFSGGAMLGPARDAASIWHGKRSQPMSEYSLPFPLSVWAVAASNQVVGVDANGTAQSFLLKGGTWKHADYLSGFVGASTQMACAFLHKPRLLMVATSTGVETVALTTKAKFGMRKDLKVPIKHEGGYYTLNSLAYAAGINPNNVLVAGREKTSELGPVQPNHLAIAEERPLVAWVSPDNHLFAANIRGAKPRQTSKRLSPSLPALPQSLGWSSSGSILCASFDGGRWGWYRPLGLEQ
mgnify:CR=1 FL=1